ncbi:MAG: FecR domain-containing protein [bacterium]|nr:FecR domain-containing protein [bacterium]
MSKDNYPFGHGVSKFGSGGTERLEEILRAQSPDVVSQGFRSGLKRSFVDGDMAGQEVALELVSNRLVEALESNSTPAPDPEFRSKMRGLFLKQETLDKANPEEGPGLESVREIRAADSRAKMPGPLPGYWAPLAAVAALLIVFLGFKHWGADSPQVIPYALGWSPHGDIRGVHWAIDGTSVEASESAEQIAKKLDAARSVAVLGGGRLRLSYGRLFQVEISERSELDLSAFGGGKPATKFHLAMGGDSGGFCFQTGPEFKQAGYELTFQTPEAQIAVVGTVFSVDRYPIGSPMMGTCVCCAEGTVQVKATHEREISTVAGKSCFVVPGDTELTSANVEPDHMIPMKDLIDSAPPSLWLD